MRRKGTRESRLPASKGRLDIRGAQPRADVGERGLIFTRSEPVVQCPEANALRGGWRLGRSCPSRFTQTGYGACAVVLMNAGPRSGASTVKEVVARKDQLVAKLEMGSPVRAAVAPPHYALGLLLRHADQTTPKRPSRSAHLKYTGTMFSLPSPS